MPEVVCIVEKYTRFSNVKCPAVLRKHVLLVRSDLMHSNKDRSKLLDKTDLSLTFECFVEFGISVV